MRRINSILILLTVMSFYTLAHADDYNLTMEENSNVGVKSISLGDYVWFDADKNGKQNSEESGLEGIEIELYSHNRVLKRTKTDKNGRYRFKDLNAGEYRLKFIVKNGWSITTQNSNLVSDSLNSDVNSSTGETRTIRLQEGNENVDIDVGMYMNSNPNINVTTLINGGDIENIMEGDKLIWSYEISNIGNEPLFDLVIKEKNEGGFLECEGEGSLERLNPGKTLLCTKVETAIVGRYEKEVVVTASSKSVELKESITNSYIGLDPKGLKVGDRVWYDSNKNGLQDEGESGVADVRVELYLAEKNQLFAHTKTSFNGIYRFNNLLPDEYYIVFKAPRGYTITQANQGEDNKDSDVNSKGRTENFTLELNKSNSSLDMGIYQTMVTVGNQVWFDTNHDGIQDVGETGVRDINVTIHSRSNNFSKSVNTDENGKYLFSHLCAGEYFLEFNHLPYGYLITKKDVNNNRNDRRDSDVFVSEDQKIITQSILLTPSENNLSWDMGIYKTVSLPGKAVLGNLVWEDFNKNGIQDIGEGGVENVKVTLFNNDSNRKVAETYSDKNGLYEFINLNPSFTYYIQFEIPRSYVVTLKNQDDDLIDSDVDSQGRSRLITLEANKINSTVDMGLYHKGSTIGDRVWYDEKFAMSNGIQDEGEYGVQNVEVILYSSDGSKLKRTFTNASGIYHFTNLPKGRYEILFTHLPDGYIFTQKSSRGSSKVDFYRDFGEKRVTVDVDGVKNLSSIDAGIRPLIATESYPDIVEGISGKSRVVDVLANDVEGTYLLDPHSVKIVTNNHRAILSDDARMLRVVDEGVWHVNGVTGEITFTPNNDFLADPTPISYSVSNQEGGETISEVMINYPPVAEDDRLIGVVGEEVVVKVLNNDHKSSTPLDKTSVRIIDPETGENLETLIKEGEGTWSSHEDGSIVFTPEEDFQSKSISIDYRVKEQSGELSNPAKVSIVYPDAVDDVYIMEVVDKSVVLVDVLKNDSSNIDASQLSLGCQESNIRTLTVEGEGVWRILDRGRVSFTPTRGFRREPSDINYTVGLLSGKRSNCATIDLKFKLFARDDHSLMNVGVMTLLPILNNDSGVLNPKSVILILPKNISGGSSVSEDKKTLTIKGEGIWSVNSMGVVSFRREDDFNTTPTPIYYRVKNFDEMVSNIAKITLTQSEENRMMVRNNVVEAEEGKAIEVTVLDTRKEFEGATVYLLDEDRRRVQYREIEGEGIWSVNSNQTITFTPEFDYAGLPMPISYVIQDNNGFISNATMIIIVGKCKDEVYEESLSVLSNGAGILIFLLGTLSIILFLKREEKMRYR